jgi:hypothetical protein
VPAREAAAVRRRGLSYLKIAWTWMSHNANDHAEERFTALFNAE